MASDSLTVHQNNPKLLSQIQDTVKALFGVSIHVEKTDNTSADEENKNITDKACTNTECDHSRSKQNGPRFAAGASSASSAKGNTSTKDSLLITVLFQNEGSQENTEKAKNFACHHLNPSSDYTINTHQLRDHQEFEMVLECSQEIQKSSAALLTLNPHSDELTISGGRNSVAVATSQVIMILDRHREQTSAEVVPQADNHIENDVHSTKFSHLDNLILSPSVEKQNTTNLSRGCREGITSLLPRKNVTEKANKNDCDAPRLSAFHTVDKHYLYKSQYSVETDCEPDSSLHIFTGDSESCEDNKHVVALKKLSFSSFSPSSSDDENCAEEDILTDPRYSKQVEQAVKLGYTEAQCKQALAKLGPDCELNDLLSELIKIGAEETALSSPSQQGNDRELQEQSWSGSGPEDLGSNASGSVTDNAYQEYANVNDSSNLRHIIIDGSNVAMSHGKKMFSCRGIKIAVDWFRDRGHKNITAFVPQWRKETSRPDAPISDQDILSDLEKEGVVVFTPARRVKGKRVVCYDDRYILKLAVETDGIVVSNDVYRDLVNEREEFRQVVDQRLLMYSFVRDRFMPPEDPLGRLGPTLDNFLRKTPAEPSPKPLDCPYGKKCTYGNKCRFYHPERGFAPQKLITETLKEQADLKLQERATKRLEIAEKGKRPKQKLARTKSLVPGELLPASMNTSLESDILGKKEKPKLLHSKSLYCPHKTSDYLNESRKKLEEAEMSAAFAKMSVQQIEASRKQPFFPESSNLGIVNAHNEASQTQAANHRTSPLPHKDSGNQTGLPRDVPKTTTSKSPRASPTHLTVPKSESRERFLSGHLYVAKTLSDESKENNFFSEHTSSPSSTRTSSPVVSNKSTEQKQQNFMEYLTRETQGNSSYDSGTGMQQQFAPQLLQQYQANELRVSHDLDNLPKLSVFEQNSQHFPSDLENPAANRRSSADSAIVLSPNVLAHSSDSHFTGYSSPGYNNQVDQISSPFPNFTEFPPPNIHQYKSNTITKVEPGHQPHEHLNLRRAFSSTGNVKSEEEHQPSGRRASGFAASQLRSDHAMLKSQQSVPAHRRTSAYQMGHPHGLTRQNSSSDPQIHNIQSVGEMSDVFLPASLGTSKLQDPHALHRQQLAEDMRQLVQPPLHTQQFDSQQYQRLQHLQHQQQLQYLQQQQLQQQQQQDACLMSPQYMPKPTSVSWGQSSFATRPPLVQSPPQHSHLPMPSSGNMSHLMSCSGGDQGLISAGPHMSSPPHSSHFSQHQAAFPTQYPISSPVISPTNLKQSFSTQPSYPHHQTMLHMYGLPEQVHPMQSSAHFQSAQSSSSHYPPAMPRILPEDAPIVPSDPRYTLYYNLSSVFSEQDVRKVMNMHPSELNPDRVCNLITKYRETK